MSPAADELHQRTECHTCVFRRRSHTQIHMRRLHCAVRIMWIMTKRKQLVWHRFAFRRPQIFVLNIKLERHQAVTFSQHNRWHIFASMQTPLKIGIRFISYVFRISDVHKVQCSEKLMKVDIALPDGGVDESNVYLEGMKGFPNPKCRPIITGLIAQFSLPLDDFYECGVTRVRKYTVSILGARSNWNTWTWFEFHFRERRCSTTTSLLSRRTTRNSSVSSALRLDRSILRRIRMFWDDGTFYRPVSRSQCKYYITFRFSEVHRSAILTLLLSFSRISCSELDITSSVNARAPEPKLDVAVRQGGQIVTGELNVSPGTPLSMEIYLDSVSAPVYGLGVTYMQVTDTKSQEETIIFNG